MHWVKSSKLAPRRRGAAQERTSGAAETPHPGNSLKEIKARVLLAEDSEVNTEIALEFLSELGCEAEAVPDGAAALAAFGRGFFDIILMDCQMPVMDGLEAARRIREDEARSGLARTPIVAMTANSSQSDRPLYKAAGMDDFLGKPFTEATLAAVIKRALELKTSAAEKERQPLPRTA